eukprot:Skav235674  [mRNA]  locus=scaffold358:1207972:1219069:- [translate_table: standard]
MQPMDKIYGCDLRDPEAREQLKSFVREQRPRLVLVEYPCTFWSPLSFTNDRTMQEKRRLAQLRKGERPFLDLCEDLFNIQLETDGDLLLENPLASQSIKEPPLQRILNHPKIYMGVSHGCQFNFRSSAAGLLLKKPTMWISTSQEILDELSQRCPNTKTHVVHQHGECQGGSVARNAGKYTPELARAIHRGYIRLIKRKDPNRLSRLLLGVKKRLGKPNHGLKWTDHSVDKVLAQVNAVFVQGDADMEDDPGEGQGQNSQIHPSGVTFNIPAGRKLDQAAQSMLRKLHCNLGHPHKSDMQRFLRGAGASQDMVEAAGFIECAACAKSQRPRLHRTARIPPHDLQFNDQVMVDCFQVKDTTNKGHWFFSILDRATMYHQVVLLCDHTPETFVETFFAFWVKWAGKPLELSIDLETGLGSRTFGLALGEAGVTVVPIAGQAHWQHGKIERRGSILKDMLGKAITQVDCTDTKQLGWVADEITMAKNMLVREHGFSPSQLLFGKEPRAYGEIEENGDSCAFHPSVGDKDSQVATRMKLRCEARQAFVRSQAHHMMMRTARNRTRPWSEPQIGDKCFFYREFRKKGVQGLVKAWRGPALVVGLQGQSNVWLVFGGRAYLVAQEHCREAVGEEVLYGKPEVQEALTLFKGMKTTQGEYDDLTRQGKPNEESLDMPVDDDAGDDDEGMDHPAEVPQNPSRVEECPEHLKALCSSAGWKTDHMGNPVLIAYKSYALRVPVPKYDSKMFPFVTKGGVGYGVDETQKAAVEDDGKGWVWLAAEMSPGGASSQHVVDPCLAVELFKSVPYGKRAVLVAKQGNVDELFQKVNWDTALANIEVTFGGPQVRAEGNRRMDWLDMSWHRNGTAKYFL